MCFTGCRVGQFIWYHDQQDQALSVWAWYLVKTHWYQPLSWYLWQRCSVSAEIWDTCTFASACILAVAYSPRSVQDANLYMDTRRFKRQSLCLLWNQDPKEKEVHCQTSQHNLCDFCENLTNAILSNTISLMLTNTGWHQLRQNLWRHIASQTLTQQLRCVSSLLACAQPVGGISLPARGVKTGMRSGNQVQGAVGMPLRWNTEDSKKVHMIPMSVKCVYWQSGIQLESQKGMQTRGTSWSPS